MRQEVNESKEAGGRSPRTAAPSLANAQKILRYAALNGFVTWTKRFLRKCALHGINTTDAVAVLCTGILLDEAIPFDAANNGWRYRLVGVVDGRKLCVEVLLDCTQDFSEAPLVVIVTACWWRGRIRSPKE